MYYEFESRFNMNKLVFDDECLTAGEKVYPYDEIEKLEVTSAPLFATYGVLTVSMQGKDIPILFPRSYAGKIQRVIHELERERSSRQRENSSKRSRDQMSVISESEPDLGQGSARQPLQMDPYEEMKKLKELLDLDIITKEEFDRKKKELLHL
ncbi:MAG: SHOCT domain-containing protein [Eubacterium sp.]|nr:SHOCT domain-containing protein [Eubacterium sp.]